MGGGFNSHLNLAILVCCEIIPDLTRVQEVEKRDLKVSPTCVMLQFKVVKTDRSSANLNLLGISVFSLLLSCKPPNGADGWREVVEEFRATHGLPQVAGGVGMEAS